MSSIPKSHLTPQQYLDRERHASHKSEYYRGDMFAMAGATRRHHLIVGNLVRELGNALKDRPCEVYPSDMRVKVLPTGLYTYPDVVVVCGEPKMEDSHADTLLTPAILFEVLSGSTESYDRGGKFRHYREIESLQEYVIVAQDQPSVERYVRQIDGRWLLNETQSLEEASALDSIGVSIPMAEIYRNISFEDPGEASN